MYSILLQDNWLDVHLLFTLAIFAFLYGFLIKHYTTTALFSKQCFLFIVSLILFYFSIESPISHVSMSTHMVQMSILYFMVPPILLLGIPSQIFRFLHRHSWTKTMKPFIISPNHALISFAILFFLYHIPSVLTWLLQHSFLLKGYSIILLLLAFPMWWPIVAPMDILCAKNKLKMKRYATLSGIYLMPACLFFILSGVIDLNSHPFLMDPSLCLTNPSGAIGFFLSPIGMRIDQVIAGLLMMGIHKIGMIIAFRLRTTEHSVNQKIF
ncbi:putative membrane protein [Oikeobacillus pervagus]|uniref:Membrane protein n=1 Tax=Oikeobacillus pervagus TaxID=1325931 RepID=A0AAJ1WK00_9BACI|nr:cytochrome c oxidase assembly protein [Oikeobacillus pervagus]MDQ0216058.1 putative membrane protein [Oikeobacillus pervagus]